MLLQGENNNKNGQLFKEIKIIAKPSFINVYTHMQYKIKKQSLVYIKSLTKG